MSGTRLPRPVRSKFHKFLRRLPHPVLPTLDLSRRFSRSFYRFQKGISLIFNPDASDAQKLTLIIGLACIGGFVVDLAVASLPLSPFVAEWRLGVLQLISDRSIVLLFGFALISFALRSNPYLKRPFSRFCLILGIVLWLSGILVFRDVINLRQATINNIDFQAKQALNQLREAGTNPQATAPEITPEQISQATQQVEKQAEALQAEANKKLFKTLAVCIGNLLVAGLALIAIGLLP